MSNNDNRLPTVGELAQLGKENREKIGKLVDQQDKTSASIAELTEQVKNLGKQIGGVDKIFGDMAEYVSYNNLKSLLREQASIAIDRVAKRLKVFREEKDYEFDLIAPGPGVVVVIEVKTTLRSDNISDFAAIMPKFTDFCSEYEGRDVYGGFAYMKAQDGAEALAHKHGMLTIRAIGGSTSELVGFEKTQLRNFRRTSD